MRLLNVNSGKFQDFTGQSIPSYITASHRWSDDETTYQDVRQNRNIDSAGYKKVEAFCTFARNCNKRQTPEQCNWIWIDNCCIDKTSSAEVTEAINSMFCWYKQAHHCIAYLADVRPLSEGIDAVMDDFRRSEWFERGWTLQELVAPRCVIFLSQDWEPLGHKCSSQQNCAGCAESNNVVLNQELAEITGVPENVLWNYEDSKKIRPREKWNWTAHRRTTKPEDTAYCLLGIFDVYMPLIYGEGARNASKRLRQEITKRNKAIPREQRPGRQKEWTAFSGKPLFVTPNGQGLPGIPPRQCQTQGQADWFDSDSEGEGPHHNDIGGPLSRISGSALGKSFPNIRRTVTARLTPAQIAVAGDYLPMFDLNKLSKMSPAQIALAVHDF